MSHIKVVLGKRLQSVLALLKSIGRLDYPNFTSQDDECVTAMMTIPPGESMGQVHIADQSDKAHEMKGTDHDAGKYYLCNHYRGYQHVLNIAQSVYGSPASQLMTISRDGASQLLNGPPTKCFNESISQNYREESLSQIVVGVYDHSNVVDDAIQDENRNPHVRDPGAQTLGYRRSFPVQIFWRLLPHHAT